MLPSPFAILPGMPRFHPLFTHPLLHFALLGGLLWGLYQWVTPSPSLVVTEERRTAITRDLTLSLHRPPTSAEVERGILAWIDEELLVKEARALGLDRGDPIVRRRLLQKMRALHAAPPHPFTEAELEAFRAEHASRYQRPARFALTTVRAGEGEEGRRRAVEFARALDEGSPSHSMGLPDPEGSRTRLAPASTHARRFGDAFAAALPTFPRGRSRAQATTRGWYAVRVDEVDPAADLPLAAVRQAVEADLAESIGEIRNREAVDRLRGASSVQREDRR